MNLIKKIIAWIISLFKSLFKKKKTSRKKINKSIIEDQKIKNKNKKMVDAIPDETMPSYMLISDSEKIELIKSIQNIQKKLKNNNIKEKSIERIIDLLKNTSDINYDEIQKYLSTQDFSKLNFHKIQALLDGYDDITKEKINEIIKKSQTSLVIVNDSINNLELIKDYIEENDISFITMDLLNNELEKSDVINESSMLCDKNIINKIKNWDKTIIDKTKLEYDVVNYVTLSTVMIDDIIDDYNKILDDYQHKRYNKSYYEKQLGKIKEKIDYLRRIKNSSVVYNEIERLRRELYTKSKDKYDILYNNEIFIDIDKKCDELLEKVNQKVVDIKKVEEKREEEQTKKEEEEYWKKVFLRFQDLSLSNRLILLHNEIQQEKINYEHISVYISEIYKEFIKGVNGPFNYEKNRVKTELVNLYNDLNMIIAKKENKEFNLVSHINFKMDDLVNAVIVKKEEVEKDLKIKDVTNSELVDEKLDSIREEFIEKNDSKVFSKGDRRTA